MCVCGVGGGWMASAQHHEGVNVTFRASESQQAQFRITEEEKTHWTLLLLLFLFVFYRFSI